MVLGAATASAGRSFAFGDASKFVPAIVQHAGAFEARASGLKRLAWELQRRTSVEAALEVRPFRLTAPQLFEHPLVVLTGDSELPALQSDEVDALRRYLTFGGLLFVESTNTDDKLAFDNWVRREMLKVFPQQKPTALPSTHVLFKSYYLIEAVAGRILKKPNLEAWSVNKRAAVIYSQNDILGALNRDETGSFEFDCVPTGERQRESAIRLATNLVLYALCLDYKDDAVHLPEIMKRRR